MLHRQEIDLAVTELADRPAAGLKAFTLLKLPLVLLVRADAPPASTQATCGPPAPQPPTPLIAYRRASDPHQAVPQRDCAAAGYQWTVARSRRVRWIWWKPTSPTGFGVGLSVEVPEGPTAAPGSRALPLPGFPAVDRRRALAGQIACCYPPLFLELIKARAVELRGKTPR